MKILWLNCVTDKSFSHTELIEIPPLLQSMGDQIRVVIAGDGNIELPDFYITLPMPFGKLRAYRLLTALSLPYLCLKYKPDVLITDWMSAALTRSIVLLRRLGILHLKLVHDIRTVPVKEDRGKARRVYEGALDFARRHFDGVTTITEVLRDDVCSENGLPPAAIAVWSSGVNVHHFQPLSADDLRRDLGLEGKFIVFYHGSVNVNRGVIELAEAVQHLVDIPDLRIMIVGGGDQWDTLRSIVREKRLDQVMLKPGIPYAQIPAWIALADLCVVPLPDHPWWRVSSPLKLMEYLAMGKPVLLTDMRAHHAVIPDNDAFYIAEATADAFAAGIRLAMKQRSRFADLGEKGRKRAESELTWQKQAEILRDYLEGIISGIISLRGIQS